MASIPSHPTVSPTRMHPERRRLAWINGIGGGAVIASYVHGFATHPATRGALWGEIPGALQPLYTVSMLLAAAGYFAFTYFVFFRLDPDRARVGERFGFRIFNAVYAGIVTFSALWMPLTFAMLDASSPGLWIAIRLTLFAVGIASLALVAALLTVRPREPAWAHRLAVLGSLAFAFQTAVLDALIWPVYFPA